MTPLEAAARAAYESTGLFKWEEVRDKGRVIAAMRAALLALAECELPKHATQIGIDAATNIDSGEDIQPTDRAFRAMLRSIASEGKDK